MIKDCVVAPPYQARAGVGPSRAEKTSTHLGDVKGFTHLLEPVAAY